MHTIKLQVKDSMYEHFLYLLKNLNPKEISVIEEYPVKNEESVKNALQKLLKEKKVPVFQKIDDPVKWQREQRDEW